MSLMDTLVPMELAEGLAQALELPDSVMQTVAAVTYSIFGPACEAFEAVVEERIPEFYQQVDDYIKDHKHPFAERMPFLNVWHVAFSMVSYFGLIVGFTIVGRIAGKRSYRLLGIMHNLFLYLLSLYMCVGLMFSARAAGYSLWNNAAGTSEKDYRVAKFVWLFYVSKVPEWIDTGLMLLKHNYRQVTFLHVYHHLSIYIIWWFAAYKAPGGEAYYSAMVNSGIHVCMYGYYFLTMIFPSGPVRKFLMNFKFVITKGQMLQFFFNCLQSVYDLVIVPSDQLKYSRGLLVLLFWYMVSLLALFGNFLMKNKKHKHSVDSQYTSPIGSPTASNGNGHSNGNGYINGNGHNNDNGHSNGNGHSKNSDYKNGMTKAQVLQMRGKTKQKKGH